MGAEAAENVGGWQAEWKRVGGGRGGPAEGLALICSTFAEGVVSERFAAFSLNGSAASDYAFSVDYDLSYLADFHLCQEFMEQQPAAITTLRERVSGPAAAFLIKSGAEPSEAEDLVESLWADLLGLAQNDRPRIAAYHGRCAFQTWFNTVALNKLIDKKRKTARWRKLISETVDHVESGGGTTSRGALANPFSEAPEDQLLIEILRDAIEYAFRTCEPEDFVLLVLRHCDRIQGNELAVMFNCDRHRISNRLRAAEEQIARSTAWRIRQKDQWLQLRWEDFVELCRTATPGCFGLD